MAEVRGSERPETCTELGLRSAEVLLLTGLTYRQLDYYAKEGIVAPSVAPAAGSGSVRRWSLADVAALRLVVHLRAIGLLPSQIKDAIDALPESRPTARTILAIAADSFACSWHWSHESFSELPLKKGAYVIFDVSELWPRG